MNDSLKKLSQIEGYSLLALLFVAMPIKYLAGEPILVRWVGMVHGILFLVLAAAILYAGQRRSWRPSTVAFCLMSTSIPCGWILFERRLRNGE